MNWSIKKLNRYIIHELPAQLLENFFINHELSFKTEFLCNTQSAASDRWVERKKNKSSSTRATNYKSTEITCPNDKISTAPAVVKKKQLSNRAAKISAKFSDDAATPPMMTTSSSPRPLQTTSTVHTRFHRSLLAVNVVCPPPCRDDPDQGESRGPEDYREL